MGKQRKEVIKKKKFETPNTDTKINFLRNIMHILPLVILLIFSINIFIYYYLSSVKGLIFLYNLFSSGNFILYSSYAVAMILGVQVLILKELNSKIKNVLIAYVFISGVYFAGAPSFLYNMILSNKLNWTGYLIVEYFWEFTAFVIIVNVIKNYKQKKLVLDKTQ